MPYIIDGHNLIPHIPGINLSDMDDENSLVGILRKYASQRRSQIEVYFDKAPAVKSGTKKFGLVTAHYIKADSTADQAIKKKLFALGKNAKNWTVVSSDREVLSEAKSHLCKTIRSSDFAGMLAGGHHRERSEMDKSDQPEISNDEVDFWLDQFNGE
jgi:predicted RNA-binding protein with PIN domain